MVAEVNFEKELVVKYIVDKLEYNQLTSSAFNSYYLMIPSVVKEFITKNHQQLVKDIIKNDFLGDSDKFWDKFMSELSFYLYGSPYNVAIQLHPKRHGGFKFLNKYSFNLYYAYDNKEKDKNYYHVIRQIPFLLKQGISNKERSIAPDVGIFVNGFLISFMQLKLQHRNQSAEYDGRGQILGDYFEAISDGVVDYLSPTIATETKNDLIFQATKQFHGPIHMVSMDTSSAYILRGIHSYYGSIEKELTQSKAGGEDIRKEILKNFFIDPVYIKDQNLPLIDKMEKVLFGLYAKDNIQQEILYLNHLGYDNMSVHSNGKKQIKYKNNTPTLRYPRPNQKYGVNKVINEVLVKYKNEDNPNYELEKLEKKLIADNVSQALRTATLEKRKAYKNNRMQYSMLLQYAAGFGKTNIICWLSLMLKDMKEQNDVNGKSNYLFDKIVLLSDRVELRDQIDLAMSNMNIEKELYKEATTTEELSKYLSTFSTRIIIVNIQKFPFLKDMAEARKKLLKNKRVAFIIDEIHRSNSGKQHTEMTTLFDDIAAATSDDGVISPKKKNLIIGLTATPTDENLIRWGEYQGCLEDIKWMPLDSYTMAEAIADGFVLDPTKGLVPCALEIKLDDQDIENKKLPSIKDYYESESEYIRPVAKKIAKILVGTTFRKIGGYAKGMLACYSIIAAKAFYKTIKEELDKLTSLPKYQKYKDAKVYMVYSSTQEDIPAHKICDQ